MATVLIVLTTLGIVLGAVTAFAAVATIISSAWSH